MNGGKVFGFHHAGQGGKAAWFYHKESAENFARVCWPNEWTELEIETELLYKVKPRDILDTPGEIWTPAK
ncbi:MAG: hypothetical protein ABSH28_01865 [Acidobacteriota bacterium]|jgi:hypothetical protein